MKIRLFGIVALIVLVGTLNACSSDEESIDEPHQYPCGQPYRHGNPRTPCGNLGDLTPDLPAERARAERFSA